MTFNTPVDIGDNSLSEQDGQQFAKNIEQTIREQIQKEQRPEWLLVVVDLMDEISYHLLKIMEMA